MWSAFTTCGAAQATQTPPDSEYVVLGQSSQVVWSALGAVPRGHDVQVVLLAFTTEEAAHSSHGSKPVALYVAPVHAGGGGGGGGSPAGGGGGGGTVAHVDTASLGLLPSR